MVCSASRFLGQDHGEQQSPTRDGGDEPVGRRGSIGRQRRSRAQHSSRSDSYRRRPYLYVSGAGGQPGARQREYGQSDELGPSLPRSDRQASDHEPSRGPGLQPVQTERPEARPDPQGCRGLRSPLLTGLQDQVCGAGPAPRADGVRSTSRSLLGCRQRHQERDRRSERRPVLRQDHRTAGPASRTTGGGKDNGQRPGGAGGSEAEDL